MLAGASIAAAHLALNQSQRTASRPTTTRSASPSPITTRNIARTQLLAEPSPLEVRALGALPHGKLCFASQITWSPGPRSPRRNVTRFWGYTQDGCKPSDIGHLAHGVAS